jgi:hypothetical protein
VSRLPRAALLAFALAAAGTALLLVHVATAPEGPAATLGAVAVREGRVVATFDLSEAFPPDVQRQLGSGLTNVVTLLVSLVPEKGDQPVSIYGRTIEILYDVWKEAYQVVVKDPEHPSGRTFQLAGWKELRPLLTEAKDVDLAPASTLSRGSWVAVARVELNPVSRELLERTREIIANPLAATGADGGSPSVLGAMASFLLRGAQPSPGVHFFRSRPFTVEGGSLR